MSVSIDKAKEVRKGEGIDAGILSAYLAKAFDNIMPGPMLAALEKFGLLMPGPMLAALEDLDCLQTFLR